MEKTDTRKLKPEIQEHLRKQIIQLRKSGKSNKEISQTVGIHHTNVCKIYAACKKGGLKAIESKTRGRRTGTCRTLDPAQENQLKRVLTEKTPDQLKFPFGLWTLRAVKDLILQLFSIDMPIRTVGEYLGRRGFTPQKPLRRACEQNPGAVKQWLEEQYPAIVETAKKEQAEINWGDETGLCNTDHQGRGCSPKGQTPVIRLNARRERVSLISAITNQGKVRFMLYDETMNAQAFIKFCKRLIKDAGKKICLIPDNLRVHHSNAVREWVERHKEQIRLFFMPSYSPELNPDEYLNCDLKAGVCSKTPARSKSQLKSHALSHLRMLQKKPQRVAKYFKHPQIAYAA